MTSTMMGQLATGLQKVLRDFGSARACEDATWLQSILADYSPQTAALNRVAALAAREGVPAWLTAAASGQVDAVVTQAVTRLVSGHGIDQGVAVDAVLAWAQALGLSTSVPRASSPSSGTQALRIGDRVARLIEKLLDDADSAQVADNYAEAVERYEEVLVLEPLHTEAARLKAFAMLKRDRGRSPELRPAPSGPSQRASWMQTCGEDTFGRWAAVSIAGVEHKFRWCPPGRFLMGSPASEAGRYDDDGPQREVELTQGFWIGEAPVTQRQWEAVTGSNPSRFKGPDLPVEKISWNDAQAWMSQANARTGALGLRFPTEAEWEYAARAGTTGATYRGGNDAATLDAIAWYRANSGDTTHPVKQKAPNPWGLYDTLGNVYEWCAGEKRKYTRTRKVNRHGGLGDGRVYRGGSWYNDAQYVRAACRSAFSPDGRFGNLGFRLARGQ